MEHNIILRNYQAELFEKIKNQNAILYLPTGSGKTCIALWLIKHMSKQLKKPISEGGKRTYFLVNTVELVYQQTKYIQNLSSLEVTPISGDLGVDTWNKSHWNHVQANFEVIVMTSQIYLNALSCGFLELKHANLIIFDECHHAVNNHPMREIMNQFLLDVDNCPRVLGLSATLLNANSKKHDFNKKLLELEKTFQAKILTSKHSEEIKKFSAKPEEIIEHFSKYIMEHDITTKIKSICENAESFVKIIKLKDDETVELLDTARLENKDILSSDLLMNVPGLNRSKLLSGALKDILVHIVEFGLYFGYVCTKLYIIQLYRFMYVSEEPRYVTLILYVINVAQTVRKFLNSEIEKMGHIESLTAIIQTSTPKLKYLFDILKKMQSSDKCLIFVERKMTAKTLYNIVKMYIKIQKSSHNVDFIVGSDSNPLRNTREGLYERKIRKKIMNEFRGGSLNVLIATNILEEGIDVQNCNIVVMFDELKTYRSYVQSKGRARMKGSKYIILNDVEKIKFENNLNSFRAVEGRLDSVINENDIMNELRGNGNETSEFFITKLGARIKAENSVPIIYRYCSTLPRDLFTDLVPYWWITANKKDESKCCKLQLPVNSEIRTVIVGPKCSNGKTAKQAVAFKAVKLLHDLGALDDHLLPMRILPNLEDNADWLPNWEKNSNNKTDGTRKEIFNANIKVPKFLLNCPRANATYFLHVIRIKTEYPEPNIHRRIYCHGLLSAADYEFGIITSNEMPEICEFPIYTDLGKIKIKIECNAKKIVLREEEIEDICKFHKFLFLNVLRVVQKCFMYDLENDHYFIVPLKPKKNKNREITLAWQVIREKIETRITHPSNLERETEEYSERNFLGKVIKPWYLEKKQYYVVTKVNTGINLQSKMPETDMTYAEYFNKKYGLVALRSTQPMMEVRPITVVLECIKPRPVASSEKQRKRLKKDFQTYLPPEFCLKQVFPAVYWYKSIILPSVCHRFYYLLLAEDLRQKFIEDGSASPLTGKITNVEEKTDADREDESNYFIEIIDEMKSKNKDLEKPKSVRKHRKSLKIESTAEEDLPKDIYRGSDNMTFADINFFSNYVDAPLFGNREFVNTRLSIGHLLQKADKNNFKIDFVNPPQLFTLKNSTKGPNQYQILQALTLKGSNDTINLERLETLGDSFLKYAVSFSIFVKEKKMNEGLLTILKGQIIGNKNLFYCAKKLGIPAYIKALKFSVAKSWYPPGFSLPRYLKERFSDIPLSPSCLLSVKIPYHEQFSGDISLETIESIEQNLNTFHQNTETVDIDCERAGLFYLDQQELSHKSISDVVEALIGVYLQTAGIKGAFDVLNYFGILPNLTFNEIMATRLPMPASSISIENVEFLMPNYAELEKLIDYEFNDKTYILQALTHPSCITNTITDCYQKLEFVGDAVLDFLITSYIYQYCGNLSPGQLTDLRSSLVNNNTFGALAIRLGLHKYILAHSKPLQDAIEAFLLYQQDKNYEIHGNELMKLVNDKDTTICEEVDIPKALGDVFEAIAGAVFLDSQFDLKRVWRIFFNFMKGEIQKFSENVPLNPVRALYEQNVKLKFFPLINDKGSQGDKTFSVKEAVKTKVRLCVILKRETKTFTGQGMNTTSAKRAAAKLALKDLGYSNFVI